MKSRCEQSGRGHAPRCRFRLHPRHVFGGSCLVGLLSWGVLELAIALTPLPDSLNEKPVGTPTLLDRQGRVVAHFPGEDGVARIQIPVPLERTGAWLPQVTVALEDHRFHRHGGVDVYALCAAAVRNLRHPEHLSGASTISQQLIKLCDGRQGRTLSAKFRESILAIKLERQWPKERILEAYLDRLDYGNRRIGPEAAAQAYFGKPAARLTLPEAVYLAGLPQAPTRFNPWKHPGRAEEKFFRAAARLRELDWKVPDAGLSPPRIDRRQPTNRAVRFTEAMPERLPGVQLTTLDLELQETARRFLREQLMAIHRHDVRNAAMVVIENATGAVRVLTSVATEEEDAEREINGALVPRHAGSTLKPFVYLLGIDERRFTAATLFPDTAEAVPQIFSGYDPNNYSRRYRGPVRLRDALANSYNVPAVVALDRIGSRHALRSLSQWGLNPTEQVLEEVGAGFVLGNLSVRPLDLAAAYASLARGGLFEEPHFLENDREPILRLASEAATQIITDVLCDNVARSKAFGLGSPLQVEGHRCAVKTGTSSSYRDGWTAGFDRDHTVVVWFGNYNGRSMWSLRTVESAAPVWSRMIRHLVQSRGSRPLGPPDLSRLSDFEICATTGLRPGAHSAQTLQELFLPGTEPDGEGTADAWFEVDGKGQATLVLPAEYGAWCRSEFNHLAARVRRPEKGLEILSPRDGGTYLYDRELPAAQQALILEADREASEWTVNGLPTPNPWPLQRGEWVIEASAGKSRSQVRIVVE